MTTQPRDYITPSERLSSNPERDADSQQPSDAPPRWFAGLILGFILGVTLTLAFYAGQP